MALFGTVSASNPPSFRNILINGAMDIYQRGQTSTGLTGEQYGSADRMKLNITTAGTWSMNVVNDGPTGTGFRNSCNVICTTADSSLASGDYVVFAQLVEGQNLQATKKGSANAESITISFWAKSSNTGTYVCELYDADNSRQASKSFTINSANTWEREVITFTPDTTGQFDNDNALSLYCQIWMAAGTNFTSGTLSNGSWNAASSSNRAVGQLNLANRVGNYMAITGWQMEIGSVATEFERRPYGMELQLCQRYYEKTATNTNLIWTGDATINQNYYLTGQYVVPKRATATFTGTGTGGNSFNAGSPADAGGTSDGYNMGFTCTSTGARRYFTAGYTASAEL